MSSPITDSRERAMAENPVSAPPPAASNETLKPFGQGYQYAETLQNPFPEVIFTGVPNPVHPGAGGGGSVVDGDHTTTTTTTTAGSTPRPGTAGSTKGMSAFRESVWVEPADPPWLGATGKLSGGSASADPSATDPSATSTASASHTATSSNPTST
ncbi:hypothetical protein C8A05DRAFT_39561, partial [Staphylotrichum tortipilum]